jgi:hypothetical protein
MDNASIHHVDTNIDLRWCDPKNSKKVMKSLYNMTRLKVYRKRDDGKVFEVGSIVLLKELRKVGGKKSETQNWSGPYKICAIVGKTKFRLCECQEDGKELAALYKANRLKLHEVCHNQSLLRKKLLVHFCDIASSIAAIQL